MWKPGSDSVIDILRHSSLALKFQKIKAHGTVAVVSSPLYRWLVLPPHGSHCPKVRERRPPGLANLSAVHQCGLID